MRKIVLFSSLLLTCSFWTTAVQAKQDTEVVAPVAIGADLSAIPEKPIATWPPAAPIDWKVDLTGAAVSVVSSDEAAASSALKSYDQSMRNWSLPPEDINKMIIPHSLQSGLSGPQDRIKFNQTYQIPEPRSVRDFEWNRQRFADRVADSIFPGFGRIETKYENGTTSRIDYISTRRCGVKGWGVCWQLRF